MASLSPPFILCPLPDRKALLGIRPDCLQNKAIITLGKNIAIRYHVLEQKQESSWTTSRYWFTSPVTYCYDYGKYGAVLNHNVVGLWDEGDASLANVTKIKIQEEVFGLHSNPSGRTIVVMKNGSTAFLNQVSADRSLAKNSILDGDKSLVACEVDEKDKLCYLVTKEISSTQLIVTTTSVEDQTFEPLWYQLGNEKDVLGFTVFVSGSEAFMVYYKTDGCIYKHKLRKKDHEPKTDPVKLANLNKHVSDRSAVVMCPLNDNSSVAIYGCDPSEEGAVVIIYDVHYDLVVSRQSLKLYSIPPLMEKIDQSLFVPLGLHILVLGYRITKSLLSAVVGKHQAKLDEEVFEGRCPWVSSGWDPDTTRDVPPANEKASIADKELDSIKKSHPLIWETVQQVKIFESEGQPEAIICNHVIPAALEKSNENALDWILSTFTDIPEAHIVSMIVHSLKDADLLDPKYVPSSRLNSILQRKFDIQLLTMSLSHVDYETIKNLLMYISLLIKDRRIDAELEEDQMSAWLNWCSAMIDAHYTKFVMYNDISLVDNLLDTLRECTTLMDEVAELEPFLALTYSKTSFEPVESPHSKWRTETITFE